MPSMDIQSLLKMLSGSAKVGPGGPDMATGMDPRQKAMKEMMSLMNPRGPMQTPSQNPMNPLAEPESGAAPQSVQPTDEDLLNNVADQMGGSDDVEGNTDNVKGEMAWQGWSEGPQPNAQDIQYLMENPDEDTINEFVEIFGEDQLPAELRSDMGMEYD